MQCGESREAARTAVHEAGSWNATSRAAGPGSAVRLASGQHRVQVDAWAGGGIPGRWASAELRYQLPTALSRVTQGLSL